MVNILYSPPNPVDSSDLHDLRISCYLGVDILCGCCHTLPHITGFTFTLAFRFMDSAVVRLGKVSLLCAFIALTSWAQATNQVVVPAGSVWAYSNEEQTPTADWKEINYHQSG